MPTASEGMHFLILSRLWFPLAAALPLPQGLDERRWEDPHPGYAAPDARTVSLLVGQLGARDRRVRARAAWALGEIGQRSYVGELLARGKDESSMVREEVAKALGRIGDGQAVPVLCSLAGDRAPEVRLAAVRSLGVFADPDAVAVLIDRVTGDGDERVRLAATKRVGKKGLRLAANDRSPRVRAAAAETCAVLQAKDMSEELSRLVADRDTRVRHAAVVALGQVGAGRDAGKVVEVLRDDNPLIRRAGLRSLLSLDVRKAVAAARSAIEDRDAEVRAVAIEVLSRGLGKNARDLLWPRLSDANRRVRRGASRALVESCGVAMGDGLVAALDSKKQNLRVECIWCLGELKYRAGLPALIAATSDPVPQVGQAAVIALGKLGDARASKRLCQLLHHADADVRAAACWSIGEIGDASALPEVLSLMRDKNGTVKRHAVVALGKIGDRRASDGIVATLLDRAVPGGALPSRWIGIVEGGNHPLRAAGVWALGKIGEHRTIDVLRHFALTQVVLIDKGDRLAPPTYGFDRPVVRVCALKALAAVCGADEMAALRKALEDRESEALRRVAAELLESVTGKPHEYRRAPKMRRRYFVRSLRRR